MEWLESRAVRRRQARYQAALRPDKKYPLDSTAICGRSAKGSQVQLCMLVTRALHITKAKSRRVPFAMDSKTGIHSIGSTNLHYEAAEGYL
jgi:hypothetical protein